MRYLASGNIISIHTCVISFLTNQLTVFSRAVKHLVVFRRLFLSQFSRVEVKF